MCYVVYVTIGQKITFKPEYIAYMANKQKQKRLTIHLFYACLRISGMIFFLNTASVNRAFFLLCFFFEYILTKDSLYSTRSA